MNVAHQFKSIKYTNILDVIHDYNEHCKKIGKNLSIAKMSDEACLGFIEHRLSLGNRFWEKPKLTSIRKSDKVRYINVLTVYDRYIAGLITFYLFRYKSEFIHEACVSYRPGISYYKSFSKINEIYLSGKYDGYKVDIQSYFDSVSYEDIVKAIEKLNLDKKLEEVILMVYSSKDFYNPYNLEGESRGLKQGISISTFIADILLNDVDNVMSKSCAYYCRYCDDIIFFDTDAEARLDELKTLLKNHDLELKESKVLKVSDEKSFEFLGGSFNKNRKYIDVAHSFKRELNINIKKKLSKVKTGYTEYNLRRAIKVVQKCLLSHDNYGALAYSFRVGVPMNVIKVMDLQCKEYIMEHFTGKRSEKYNYKYFPNHIIRGCGWIPLTTLYTLYRNNPNDFAVISEALLERDFSRCRIVEVPYEYFKELVHVGKPSIVHKGIIYNNVIYKAESYPPSVETYSINEITKLPDWKILYVLNNIKED